jgi:uncharacterized protein involved in exopolysaccharide biosynthesis
LDATALGSLLVGAGGLAAAVVAFLGKRGETAATVSNNLIQDLQEERDRLDRKATELNTQLAGAQADLARESALRAGDQAEIARLSRLVTQLGGTP